MLLVTLGVVYGDIGTSPMYVMKAIVNGNGGIASVTEELILGALSLVIWTITLVTTVKYVVIAMKADNHGEGGIFALYSLVRKCARWLIIPAMVGGAGLVHFIENPGVIRALNPLRGLMFLASPNNHAGLRILGFVFLCTTGAEALYSDMGHVGKSNIYASWPFVKLCLILNYLGQGAWLLQNAGDAELAAMPMLNPFYPWRQTRTRTSLPAI
jgi:K+ transporter